MADCWHCIDSCFQDSRNICEIRLRKQPAIPRSTDLAGEPGNEATDIYALGVTLFRAFSGEYPYGNADATDRPRRERPKPLSALRPDLPAWLERALARAIAVDPGERFRDMNEFAVEIETGPAGNPHAPRRPQTFYEREPVRFWQGVAALLALALVLALWRH